MAPEEGLAHFWVQSGLELILLILEHGLGVAPLLRLQEDVRVVPNSG